MSVHQPVYVWFMELSAYIITTPYNINEVLLSEIELTAR